MEKDILNAQFLLRIAGKVDMAQHSATNFGVYLGFEQAEGSNAMISGFLVMNPKDAITNLLHKYVNKYGTREESAVKLRNILRDNGVTAAAEVLEDELVRRKIPFAEVNVPVLPSPPTKSPDDKSRSREKPVAAE
ncbi:uncharacterized protein [Diadema antillarum]|uniref:uncharacterized protein n=1 Tax=Diadema antillarum TaxID=105358 RepID=UPI003A88A65C